MPTIPFVKYTSCGNNFVILDGSNASAPFEYDWSQLVGRAVDPNFGVGCDNLLVIQRCSAAQVALVNEHHGYWSQAPDPGQADYLFRMFEPDGTEAFCCGNGLLCIARYLRDQYAVERASILTELPRARPRVVNLGAFAETKTSWIVLAAPIRTPQDLCDESSRVALSASIDELPNLGFRFRNHDLSPYTDSNELQLRGYLTFSGEPHLVIFPEADIEPPVLRESFFRNPNSTDQRAAFGTSLLERIGYFLNFRRRDLFPSGINVNVARAVDNGRSLEYRCYERGICRETLACGTGALAVASIASHLGMTNADEIAVLPYACRSHEPDAVIEVRKADPGTWVLRSEPKAICGGSLIIDSQAVPEDGYRAFTEIGTSRAPVAAIA